MPTTIATTADAPLSVTIAAGAYAAAITAKSIESNWHALSHAPERRARMELNALAERLNAFGAHVAALADAGGNVDAARECEQFARRHVAITARAWRMDGCCMSSFVVGPANFPLARNAKRQRWADAAYSAIRDHMAAAKEATTRRAFPHGLPGGPIRASNPDAPELLAAEIAKRKAHHALMKAANAALRSKLATGDDAAMAQAISDATGLSLAASLRIAAPAQKWMGRGFAAYQLSGELAEIKRLQGRLEAISANRARGTVESEMETSEGRLRIVENPDAARIQLFFDGKPSEAARAILKGRGFRWAPSEGAWQRHLNNAGRYAAKMAMKELAAQAA